MVIILLSLESNILIDGSINFNTGIDTSKSDGYYYLSGNITLSDVALDTIKTNRQYLKTYDFKAELRPGFLYDSNNYSIDKQYLFAASYNINPLISGNKAFIFDSNYDYEGSFDTHTGIFTKTIDNTKYFLKTDQDMYEEGSLGSNQKSRVDWNIEIVEIEKIYEEYKIIKEKNGGYYLYYCGLYVPILSNFDAISITTNYEITINARKFMSNENAAFQISIKTITQNADGTTTTSDPVRTNVSSCFSKLVVRYNASTKTWAYYCFEEYPKTGTETRYTY